MCKTFIVIDVIFHLDDLMLRKESFGFIQTVSGFAICEVVNTISILPVFWIFFSAFTLSLFCQFFFLFFIGNKSIVFNDVGFLESTIELDRIITFFLLPEQASLSLCDRCAAYFSEYPFSTLNSFE